MPNALLLGYFGAGNFGDELILTSFLKAYGGILKDRGFSLTLTIKKPATSEYISGLKELYEEIDVVRITPLMPYSLAVRRATHLIAPGGSLLQNATSSRSLLLYLNVIRQFERADKKVFLFNQGIGPIRGQLFRRMTKQVLSGCTFFSARDKKSALWVAEVLPPQRRFLASDAVFASLPDLRFDAVSSTSFAYGFVVKANIRSLLLRSEEFPPEEKSLISAFSEEEWMNPRKVERLGRRFDRKSLNLLAPTDFIREMKKCEVIFSERYHGLICALIAKVPFVGVGNDPKIIALCEECNMPVICDERITSRKLKELKSVASDRFNESAFVNIVEDFTYRHQLQKQILARLITDVPR